MPGRPCAACGCSSSGASLVSGRRAASPAGHPGRPSGGKDMRRSEVVRDKGIVIITPDGKLQTADFDRLAAEVDPIISANGMLNGLMVYARAFPGWSDLAAFAAHIRFITGHRGKVRRAAVVSDSALLAWAPAVAKPIVGAEVRHFPAAEKDQALAWLETGR